MKQLYYLFYGIFYLLSSLAQKTAEWLKILALKILAITGIMTNMCCESTARDAYFRDYRAFFLADGNGSINEEMHVASLLNLSFGFGYVTSTKKIEQELIGKK